MSQAKDLKQLLEGIFHDGIVEPQERAALAALTLELPRNVVTEVFQDFLHEKWGQVIADDVITAQERSLLGKIVIELELALEDLPQQARIVLKNHL